MRVLVVNPYGIGDVLFTFPVIANLRETYHDIYIGYLSNSRVFPLININPLIDRCFIYEKDYLRNLWKESRRNCISQFVKLLNTIRDDKFDLLIDFSLVPEFSFFAWLLGIKKRLGYRLRKRGIFLNQGVRISGYHNRHMVLYYLDLLRLLGITPKIFPYKISLPAKFCEWARDKINELRQKKAIIIGIIPGGGASWAERRKYKQWGKENYYKLVKLIVQEIKAGILLLGDKLDAQDFISFNGDCILNFMGKTTLLEFCSLLSQCDLVICNDGGPLHIAVALGVPTIALFGPVDPLVYGPFPPSRIHKVIKLGISCQPCYRNFHIPNCEERLCLSNITPAYVLNEVKSQLALLSISR